MVDMEDERMDRWVKSITCVCLISFVLCGCGESGTKAETQEPAALDAAAGTEIEVVKDGSIVETINEEFGEEYYDETNLRDILLDEVESFNQGQEGADIVVDRFENADGRLTVRMKYPSADAYTAYNTDSYNHKTLFCGTVAEAQGKGYDFDISMTDAKGEKTIGKEDILGMGSSKILIAEFPARVKVSGKILYVGENVAVSGKNQANMQPDENGEASGRYYIIYK